MMLSPLQETVLNKLTIPIWVQREKRAQTGVDASNTPALEARLVAADCLILLDDKTYSKKAKRLLDAMLYSIALDIDKTALITLEEIAQLNSLNVANKVLLVLGQSALDALLGDKTAINDYRGKAHQTMAANLTTIVSIGLDELLTSPPKKALVWQDLQLLKTTHQALLSA